MNSGDRCENTSNCCMVGLVMSIRVRPLIAAFKFNPSYDIMGPECFKQRYCTNKKDTLVSHFYLIILKIRCFYLNVIFYYLIALLCFILI